MYKVWSIGHSNRAFSEFLQKLKENKIEILVDVRTYPRSRFCPHFNKNSLIEKLSEAGITYLLKGKNLGGRGENIAYEETIGELAQVAEQGKRICIMCSEGDYRKCHRHQVLEPSFREKNVTVEHIEYI